MFSESYREDANDLIVWICNIVDNSDLDCFSKGIMKFRSSFMIKHHNFTRNDLIIWMSNMEITCFDKNNNQVIKLGKEVFKF